MNFLPGSIELVAGAYSEYSVTALFALLFFATFISEDLACLAAGTLAGSGRIGFATAVLACFLGIFVGDIGLYWIGRFIGQRIVEWKLFRRFVSHGRLTAASRWLEDRGVSAIFLSRFITGFRLPTYMAAGFLRTDFKKFAVYFALASAVWTPILVGSAAFSQKLSAGNVLLGLIASYVLVRSTVRLLNWRERRLLIGRVKRILKWEFWPLAVFYFPVVFYVVLLAIRFRSLTIFANANPGIPLGGFIGESKNEIYRLISRSPMARRYMLRHELISASRGPEEKFAIAENIMSRLGLNFPVVIKPDVGERGKGVSIVGSREELEERLQNVKSDVLIQEFCEGVEASVFYYRFPDQFRGTIFSITEKRFPSVTGDGKNTLENLILQDPRAVCMAKRYFSHDQKRLDQIPAEGEIVRLIDIGTHSRGAIFLDGEWLRTDELEDTIDSISRNIPGFYFGRFDIRAASFEKMRTGNFKIIELNGVTSESTNIYDPKYTLLDAYRIIFRQWKIAFEIGRLNRELGAVPASVSKLLRCVIHSSKLSNFLKFRKRAQPPARCTST